MEPSAPALTLESASPEATRDLGRRLGSVCDAGTLIALVGGLGAGKTQFVKGIAEGTGAGDVVTSPTFVLMNLYPGRVPLAHFDLYRMDVVDLKELGFYDVRDTSVVVVEWADRAVGEMWEKSLRIEFELTGASRRRLMIHASGDHARALLEKANLSG